MGPDFSAEFVSVRRAFCVALQLKGKYICISVIVLLYFNSKVCKRLTKKVPMGKNSPICKKNLVKLPYSAQKTAIESSKLYIISCFDLQSCVNTRLQVFDRASYRDKAKRPKV